MNWNKIYKIKDSIDVYLVNDEYILVYFMNTRLRKKFHVNENVIKIFEEIDGKRTLSEIYNDFIKTNNTNNTNNIEKEDFELFFTKLYDDKIICEKLERHILSDYYLKRYERQINYFTEFLDSELEAEKAQKKLIDIRMGIIGCGAVGGDIALQLAMAGIENFVFMDYDEVKESDCSRHMYYDKNSTGRKKVEVLSDKLKAINPRIKTYISYSAFTPETDMEDFLSRVDFVVNTADEPYLGYTANVTAQLCVPKNIAHYIAGGFDAHLASTGELCIPYVTPCAACYSTYFKEKLANWIPEKHPVEIRANEIGGLASMSLFSSSYACIEIVKYISGLMDMTKKFHKRAEFLFDGMKLIYLNPQKNENCKVCGSKKNDI